ncbi:glutathione synthetase ATP-binding domain-like protein [Aureobasidium pullulans]|nr:glutathione synthetase ATP-binding domain-like protein [Aureobasidium pullulans]
MVISVSGRIQVRARTDDALLLTSSWRVGKLNITANLWQSIELVLQLESFIDTTTFNNGFESARVFCVDANDEVKEAKFSDKTAQFFWQCLRATAVTGPGVDCVVRLVVPLQSGYIVRSDIIPLRLQDLECVKTVTSFADPLQTFAGEGVTCSDCSNLEPLFSAAAAGLILNVSSTDTELESSTIDLELENRLSLPWILPGPAQHKTLVLVDANSADPAKGGNGSGLYLAAQALGIKLVVLDNANHWLEEPQYAHWREAFIPTRLTNPPEGDLTEILLKSIKAYGKPIDGIITFADSYWTYIADAAKQLGIPTAPKEALRTATNKYLTSKDVGHEAYRASCLDEALDIASKNDLPYPLIVKPCDGWSSEGVSRVDSFDQLTTAIKAIDESRHGSEFVMEKYCAGPEVDANFVLLDGEVLFFEVCDDLPKSAENNGPSLGSLNNFHELNSVYPSALPTEEIDVLRNSFLDTLLKMGLKDGIMHLEGRVDRSSVDYEMENGILDLHPRKSAGSEPASAWLIEINPRPLGMTGSQIVESTYGVDYWGLALLIAVQDRSRVRALSHPFKNGPQYHCIMVFIPADYPSSCEGLYDSEDLCADLMSRRKDLASHISRSGCFVKRGQKVPHPSTGVHSFLAYFNVFSRKSRHEALQLAKEVRDEVRYSFK